MSPLWPWTRSPSPGEALAARRLDDEEALAADGRLERVPGALDGALAEVGDDVAPCDHPATDIVPAEVGAVLKCELALEADRVGVRQVVCGDVEPIERREARRHGRVDSGIQRRAPSDPTDPRSNGRATSPV
jgi:hypothetical protein